MKDLIKDNAFVVLSIPENQFEADTERLEFYGMISQYGFIMTSLGYTLYPEDLKDDLTFDDQSFAGRNGIQIEKIAYLDLPTYQSMPPEQRANILSAATMEFATLVWERPTEPQVEPLTVPVDIKFTVEINGKLVDLSNLTDAEMLVLNAFTIAAANTALGGGATISTSKMKQCDEVDEENDPDYDDDDDDDDPWD